MHLGNVWAALMSWLRARRAGGRWILRIEDLDPQRSRRAYADQIERDLEWLGLTWDEGGVNGSGPTAPYCQSLRGEHYAAALGRLQATGFCYPCTCTRAQVNLMGAPHQSDGRIVYGGRCRPAELPWRGPWPDTPQAVRLYVPPEPILFDDVLYGRQCVELQRECGDFVLRRADGAWAYQLAVVTDDAAMGVTEVVRGSDLLLSAAQQIWLYGLLGCQPPAFCHIPLLVNTQGRRLSKRDGSLSMETLRERYTPGELLGRLARLGGLTDRPGPVTLTELTETGTLPPPAITLTVPDNF